MSSAGPAFEFVLRAAIRTQGFAGFFDGQKHARMRIPQQHVRHRAVQRQLAGVYFDSALFIFLEFAHDASQMWVSQY